MAAVLDVMLAAAMDLSSRSHIGRQEAESYIVQWSDSDRPARVVAGPD
jgi:hypothetical protein